MASKISRKSSRQAGALSVNRGSSSGRRIPVRSLVLFAIFLLVAYVQVFRDADYSSGLRIASEALTSTHASNREASSSLPSTLLWDQMSSAEEQEAAYQTVKPYLKTHAAKIRGGEPRKKHSNCTVTTFGNGWGAHELCQFSVPEESPCAFVSFGINKDYSFDTDLANKKGCRGIAADPTIVHPSQLHPLVTFHNFGAMMLHENQEKKRDKREWWSISVPALRKLLHIPRIHVLKMDCEGCEYSIARDVLVEDPTFFQNVDQFAMEIHVSKRWLDSKDSLYYLGLLYKMLEESGLILQSTHVGDCFWKDEALGCMDEINEIAYPCGSKKSCHNYLFARAGLE